VFFGLVAVFEWPFLWHDPTSYFSIWGDVKHEFEDIPHDVVRPYLATSRDGVHFNFQWVYSKQPLNISSAVGYENKLVFPGPNLVTANGYHSIYYSANQHHHRHRWWDEELLFLARFRQDRIVGLSVASGATNGSVQLKPFAWSNATVALVVNAEAPVEHNTQNRHLVAHTT